MKRYITAAAAMLMVASVSAEDVYGEFAKGNPDIKAHNEQAGEVGSGTGTVNEAKVYKGLAEDNPDLRGKSKEPTPGTGTENPDIYKKIEPAPDVNY